MARLSASGTIKAAAVGAVALALAPVQIALTRLRPARHGKRIPMAFHRLTCRILGVRLRVTGSPPPRGRPVLIVSNHVSWLDIAVIGAQHPVAFVAKAEVAAWPGIGAMARLQHTLFIDRTRRTETASVSAAMGQRMEKGESVVLFAEGTTSDGNRILPFRSSLFGAVREAAGQGDMLVQPLTIAYLGRHGLPGGRQGRAELAWSGDTDFAPHAASILNGGPIDVALIWGEPIPAASTESRKEITARAEAAVRSAFRAAIHGAVS